MHWMSSVAALSFIYLLLVSTPGYAMNTITGQDHIMAVFYDYTYILLFKTPSLNP